MPKVPTLMIMDEFPQYALHLPIIKDDILTLRSYGVKLWIILQTIGQLQARYPRDWGDFVSSSNTQVFGVNDNETAQWVSNTLGSRTAIYKDIQSGRKFRTEHPLLTPQQVFNKLQKTALQQIIFPSDGLPIRAKRTPYDKFIMEGLRGHFEHF